MECIIYGLFAVFVFLTPIMVLPFDDDDFNNFLGINFYIRCMNIRFYKEDDGRWYADLPDFIAAGGCKEMLEMVCGADEWLDILVNGKSKEITLDISTERGEHKLTLKHLGYPDESMCGGYDLTSGGATYIPASLIRDVDYSHRSMWLCPVTEFVLGDYPVSIYYTIVNN